MIYSQDGGVLYVERIETASTKAFKSLYMLRANTRRAIAKEKLLFPVSVNTTIGFSENQFVSKVAFEIAIG